MNRPSSNALEVTVTELSGKLKKTVEDTFGYVRVRGEISGFRGPHSSGHCYFALKDERARLEAVIWRGQAAKLKHMPEEGLEVIASGKLTTYPGSSKYQIVIDNLEPAGAGALMALLEERRKKLGAEGLFDPARKQLLPFMPKVIGVITSPTGAVIRDILHRISDRFPVHVIVWPVRVQGETSGREVANGIYQLNQIPDDGSSPLPRPDVIIVARGGGSLEDLWGFNDEALVRSAAASMIPVISAVGHETDWTLIDHAADWRAPTPTAAAEKAVPVKAELEATLADLAARLRGSITRLREKNRSDLRSVVRGLATPDNLLAMPRRQFDEASGRLGRSLGNRVQVARTRFNQGGNRLSPASLTRLIGHHRERFSALEPRSKRAMASAFQSRQERLSSAARLIRPAPLEKQIQGGIQSLNRLEAQLRIRVPGELAAKRERLERNHRLLNSLSYQGVLDRGFAVIRNAQDTPINDVSSIKSGAALSIEMRDGKIQAVAATSAQGSTKPAPKPTPKKQTPAKDQGSLF
ncbi:MAG: exodeoxyribonuclease VII large subunit [Rhizobiaceae bacterium]|nr:exodeoxyribonuclease VII large subunit [Rhizobiaceae bacterium]